MFAIFVSRRYGLAVPIVFFVVGLLLEVCLDVTFGAADYMANLWALGLDLFLTGVITGLISCSVASSGRSSAYTSLLDADLEKARNHVQESLEVFLTEESEEDSFCYIPLNRCSMVLMVLGVLFIVVDKVLPNNQQ